MVAVRSSGSVGRITGLGEALIDFLPIEEGGQMVGFRVHPGGSFLNVAVSVARPSQPVALAGKLSTDRKASIHAVRRNRSDQRRKRQ
jgi:sugar/nucleoside kinase (ribokinase family)